jgi:hypothetical protein
LSTLSLRETTDTALWDSRLPSSPQATVFSGSAFLKAAGARTRLFELLSGQRVVALLPLTEDASGERVEPPPFTPYQGPLCLHEPGLPNRQRVLDEYRVGELLAAELALRYREVRLPLSWCFADVRPFLWHNYHSPGAPRYSAAPRYTAVLPLAGLDAASYPARVRACRRQEWRKAAPLKLHEDLSVDEFLRLYVLTFERQEVEVGAATLGQVRRITQAALAGGWGRLVGCSTAQGLASATLFVHDHTRSYYLFGANDPAQRNSGAATRLIFDNVFDAIRRGLSEVDFVGVNSPARGDFKLSFDPELRVYFELHHVAA